VTAVADPGAVEAGSIRRLTEHLVQSAGPPPPPVSFDTYRLKVVVVPEARLPVGAIGLLNQTIA
jgi:hypothetical protein